MKEWWLKEDCSKCDFYPNCDFIETTLRGCSLYQRTPIEDRAITNHIRNTVFNYLISTPIGKE